MILHGLVALTLCGSPNPEALRGVKTVSVLVESIQSAAAPGLEASLKTDVELIFRKGGVKVVDTSASVPYVYVNATLVESRNSPGLCAFNVAVSLRRTAQTANGKFITGEYWADGALGMSGCSKAAETIRGEAASAASKLLNALLAANP